MQSNDRRTTYMGDRAAPRQSFADLLGSAAAQNPLATALVGVGLLWMLGGGGQTSLANLFSPAETVAGRRRRVPKSSSVTSAVGDMAGKLASTVSGAMNATYEKASDAVETVGKTFSTSGTQDGHGGPDRWNDGHSRAARSSGPTPYGALQGLSDFLEQRPLALGAAGLALGAGIAASLPVTDTERHTLGKAGRRIHKKLNQSASQVKDAAQAALDEARTQGLVPDMVEGVLRKT